MAKDYEIRLHQSWLGLVQPRGLVVSPHALLKAGLLPGKDVGAQQATLRELLHETPEGELVLDDFPTFAGKLLGWEPDENLAGSPGAPELPDTLTVALTNYADRLEPTYALQDPFEDDPAWLLLVKVVPHGTNLDKPVGEREVGWHTSPQARFERLLRETEVPAGLLVNGGTLRLVYAPRGESSGHITVPVEALCEVRYRELLSALLMLLHADRVIDAGDGKRLTDLLKDSRRYQNDVSTRLADQVLDALWELLRGVQAADSAREQSLVLDLVRDDAPHVYGGLISGLMRLVFLLYAEDEELLPRDAVFAQGYSVSGLYERLVGDGLLVPHDEVPAWDEITSRAYRLLKPREIRFITYPYEWCPGQLRDAGLATLRIQQLAMEKGMTLKDSSAFNIQFVDGKAMLIDTLSFETYAEGKPWVGYRQFCQHFLAPLALMHYRDVRLGQMLRTFIDGVPLDIACRLLPRRASWRPSLFVHLFLHAFSQRVCKTPASAGKRKTRHVSKMGLLGMVDGLASAVRKLSPGPGAGLWDAYYGETNYSPEAFEAKKRNVAAYLDRVRPRVVWDLGANTGEFSRLASERDALTISMDYDPLCVEHNYADVRARGDRNTVPLVMDLCNPSPALGWRHAERGSLVSRGPADTILALALVHHLAIGNNVPLPDVARFFREMCHSLIVEFVPKSDSQVQRMLATREDVFPDYHTAGFEAAFKQRFVIEDSVRIPGTERTLYLMKSRNEDA